MSGDNPADLEAELAVLREENERLRRAYARSKRTTHRRTALGFGAIGLASLVAAAVLIDTRTILIAIGATGLFAGVLTYYLTPERFVAAAVGRDIYRAVAANELQLVNDLGLSDTRVYFPIDDAGSVRLFVPQYDEYDLPAAAELDGVLVVPASERSRGLALQPTAEPLVEEYRSAVVGGIPDDPGSIADSLVEALVEQFELIDAGQADAEAGRVTVGVTGSAFGPLDSFDHPVASTLGAGLAAGLEEPVELGTREAHDPRIDWQITCRWEATPD